MTGRLRIYIAGTGSLVYDSGTPGRDESGVDEDVKQAFLDGERLYYDPAAGHVRCYVNLQRNAPEQCVAVYDAAPGEGRDLLAAFREAVEGAVDERHWRIRSEAGGGQAIYDDLGTTTTTVPGLSLDRIAEVVGDLRGADFGAPDEASAVHFVNHLRTTLDPSRPVVVGYEGRLPHHDDDAVFVRANAPVAAVVPVGDTYAGLQAGLYRERLGTAERARDRLVEELAGSDAEPAAYSEIVSTALSEVGLADHGLEVRPDTEVERETKNFGLTVAVGTFVVEFAVGAAGVAAAGLLSGLPEKLTYAVSGDLSVALPGGVASWHVLVATLALAFGSYFTWWSPPWSGGPFRFLDRETAESFRGAVDALAELDTDELDTSVRAELAALLEPVETQAEGPGLEVRPEDPTPWYRKRTYAVDVAFGTIVAAGVLAMLVVSAGLELDQWTLLVRGAFWVAAALLAVNLARVLRFGARRLTGA